MLDEYFTSLQVTKPNQNIFCSRDWNIAAIKWVSEINQELVTRKCRLLVRL